MRSTFFVELSQSQTAQVFIDATYCLQSVFQSDFATKDFSIPFTPIITLVGQGLDTGTSDLGSKFSSDGECFKIKAKSDQLETSVDIEAIIVTVEQPPLTERKRRSAGDPADYRTNGYSFLGLAAFGVTEDPGALIIIQDNEPPTFTSCPNDVKVDADPGSLGAQVFYPIPVAVDNAGDPSLSSVNEPGDLFSIVESPHIITYTAVDSANLVATCEFSITVRAATNRQFQDSLTVQSFVTAQPSQLVGVFDQVSVYGDALLGAHSEYNVTFTPENFTAFVLQLVPPETERFGLSFPPEDPPTGIVMSIDILLRAGDINDLPLEEVDSSHFFAATLLNVRNSTTGESIIVPDTFFATTFEETVFYIKGENDAFIRMRGESNPFSPQDINFAGIELTLSYPLGSDSNTTQPTFHLLDDSSVAFTYFYSDEVGSNFPVSSREGHLQFFDSVSPVVTNCPGSMTINVFTEGNGTNVTWVEPTFVDDRGGVTITRNFASGDFFPFTIGSAKHTVTITGSDASRNAVTCTFDVFVLDQVAPSIACPSTLVIDADPANGSGELSEQVATIADGSGVVSLEPFERTLAIGFQNRTLVAVDGSGNEASCTIVVELRDTTPPTINCPAGLVQQDIGNLITTFDFVSASDNDATPPNITHEHLGAAVDAIDFQTVGTSRIVSFATDASGNRASCSWDYSIFDPSLGAPAAATGTTDTTTIASVLTVVGIVIAIAVFVLRRRSQSKPHNFEDLMDELQKMAGARFDGNGPVAPREMKRSHVKQLDILGKGNFGEVTKGLVNEQNGIPDYLVAVKVHLGEYQGRQEMLQEAAVMAQFKHPNVVQLVGVVTAGDPLLIVLEFCEKGELKSYLEKKDYDESFQLKAARDCASGLAYLAERGKVHCACSGLIRS